MTTSEIEQRLRAHLKAAEGMTPGPWEWVVHDISMASLGVPPDPGLGDPLVLAVGPCRSCVEHAKNRGATDWEWDRCHTPNAIDARMLAALPTILADCREAAEVLAARDAEIAELRVAVTGALRYASRLPDAVADTLRAAARREKGDDRG